jgi:hypothetical protein
VRYSKLFLDIYLKYIYETKKFCTRISPQKKEATEDNDYRNSAQTIS